MRSAGTAIVESARTSSGWYSAPSGRMSGAEACSAVVRRSKTDLIPRPASAGTSGPVNRDRSVDR